MTIRASAQPPNRRVSGALAAADPELCPVKAADGRIVIALPRP